MRRHAGVMLPLFSAWSTRGWGLGELPDVAPLSAWLASAGLDRLMLLPLGTMAAGQSSPYSAVSSMAIDPRFIALDDVPDFQAAGGRDALSPSARRAIDKARASATVDYPSLTRAKRAGLARAFHQFERAEWRRRTRRAEAFAEYAAAEGWWLDDYALYRALVGSARTENWRAWPAPIRDREPAAIDDARRRLMPAIRREQYWQWIAESQWQDARQRARAAGVFVFGDMPFMVNADSAEVWTRRGEVMLDVSLGVPPDAFSATGQDWGLPTYDWRAIAAGGFTWMRERARRMAALFDGYRVDHLVGLYRTYGRPASGQPFFNPPTDAGQIAQGEHILSMLQATGARIIAEDLGVVPDAVRESLARLGVPGCKVQRWERRWHDEGQPFIDPAEYPVVSAAMTGTHDTETLAQWWDEAAEADRAALLALPSFLAAGLSDTRGPWDARLRDVMLQMMHGARSSELLLPIQDVFGWRDRINTPGTVSDSNWTWRLPWPVDGLLAEPEAQERARFLRALG